jgi:chromosome segregation ATPase
MSQDVTQWLAEIQSLQRQVGELQQERDRAYASADQLRGLYEAEAQQRQRDTLASQRRIQDLQQQLSELQAPAANAPNIASISNPSARLSAQIERIQSNRSVEQLQAQLIAAKQQCEQLGEQLTAEQVAHAQTRESLTAALGDAVDLLAKERPNDAADQPMDVF